MKSKLEQKNEQKILLIDNLEKLRKLNYSDQEIANIIGEKHRQIVSAICCQKINYQISLKKATKINNLVDNFIKWMQLQN